MAQDCRKDRISTLKLDRLNATLYSPLPLSYPLYSILFSFLKLEKRWYDLLLFSASSLLSLWMQDSGQNALILKPVLTY